MTIAAKLERSSAGKEATFDAPVAYWSLIFLTFIMFIAPMGYFPALIPLRLAFVSATLAIFTYLLTVLSRGERVTIWTLHVKLMLALAACAAASIPFSRWVGGSYEVFIDTFSKSVIVFLLIANLLTSEKRIRGFIWALTIYSVFNALVGIGEYRSGSFVQGRIRGAGYSGLTSNPNDLALSLNLTIPFMWYLFKTSRNQLQKWVVAGAIATSITCIIVTFSRGGALTLLAILLWFVWRRTGTNRAMACAVVAGVVTLALMFAPSGYSDRLASTTDFSKDKTGSASARWELTVVGIRQTIEHPLGVGIGMNNLIQLDEGRGWTGVHNVYLEISTELGIVPAIIYIILLLKLISSMKRLSRENQGKSADAALLCKVTEGSLVAFAVAAMFHPVAYNFYFYIIAGIAVALSELAQVKTNMGEEVKNYTWPKEDRQWSINERWTTSHL